MTMAYKAATNNLQPASRRPLSHGFTMVELVAVIVVVGILGAFAAPRFLQNEVFDARAFADQNLNMLRYAQKLAIAQNRPVFAVLNSNRIALCFNPTCGTADRVLAPAGANSGNAATVAQCGTDRRWFCEGRPSNVSYGVAATGTVLFFNALGRPFLNGDVDPASTFARLGIPIGGGGPTRTVIVEAETGYVHL
ncbi:prepilin-type N-terminal cleavage/methylation domain-containing protein [Janthinobacterium sp.]|uniref:prepilin-type N-terminal cleavage/methylation domain-containing protein n=1 Tax=Janthinobacterium sp. TaxID=1871054 RepID=UPI003917E142